LAAVREELEGYITGLEKERGGTAPMRPTWIDVRHCRVTAFAEDPESGRVLAATAIPITMEKAQD
jgi:hypothetical protein